MARRLAASLVAVLLTFVLFGVGEAAEVRVIRSTFESKFPGSMVYTLEAATSRAIQRATIWYRVAGKRTVVSGDAALAQSGGTVRVQHEFDLTRDYLPPGTQLQFYWELLDDQGARSRTETYQAVLEDRRFQWRQLRAPNVELAWYTGDENYGRALMAIAARSLSQLANDAGVTLERPVRILVYSGREDFQSASFRGGLEWVGGTFYPDQNVILIYAPAGQQGAEVARRAIPHELAHAVIHQVTDNPFGDVPQWLNEGLASRSEPTFMPEQADALARAIAEKRLHSLRALSGSFPVDPDEALLAYAESYSAASFVLERYGRARVNQLLQTFREGVTYDEGLRRVLGVDHTQLDAEWRAWLAPWPMMKATPFADPPPAPPQTIGDAVGGWFRGLVDGVLGSRGG
jgi:hypothetical protein